MKSRSMFHLVSLLVMLFSLLGSAATPIPVSANIPAGLTASDWGQILALLTPAQQAYIKASNSGADDNFGKVALDGDTLVVGASGESSNATGINGNQLDNSASSAGAVYVFVRSGNTWSQQAYIKASNTDANDYFGSSIAIAGDTIVVGAYGEDSNATGINGNETNNSVATSGAVYVFTRTGSTWSQQAYIKASNTNANDWFGGSVSISGDTLVVGARGEDSHAFGVNGDQTSNINPDSGAAYVFTRTGSTWSQQAYIKASNGGGFDYFGLPVVISGDTLVVGAFSEDSNATGVNGNQTNDSSPDSGAAYVFTRTGSIWSQQAYLKASNTDTGDRFGNSLAISGDTLVVGAWQEDSNATGINGNQGGNSATDSGAAYVFTRAGSNWSQQAYIKASNTEIYDYFGMPIALSGDILLIGSNEDSNAIGVNGNQADNSADGSGAAYVFQRTGATWNQNAYIKASNTEAGDSFGSSIALSGNTLVVGADWESSNATGVNGNQADNSESASGAAYVFVLPRTVTFDANGGSGSMSNQSASTPTALTANTFTRDGYSFSGWNTATNGSGTAYANGATYDFSADVTLYAQWTAWTATFSDVPLDYWAWKYIESLYDSGITGGCSTNPLSYCPTQAVTRAQMAVFLLRGIHGASYTPPAVGASTGFTDVAVDYWAAAWIKQLAAEGITGGCGNGIYCPDNTVTRDQMAIFLLRAEHGSTYTPPDVNGSTGFTDVASDYWAAAWIKQLAAEAITGGCGGGNYCPASPVTRDQMAVFLQRTFSLPLP